MNPQEERQHILDVFHRRYATKKFDPNKKISDADWQTIIEAGRLSPSSFGYEPWKFLLIENPEIKEDLKKICWGAVNSLNGASHFVIILARKNVTITSPHVKHMVEDVMGVDFDVHSPRSEKFKSFQENDFDLNSDRALFDWASKQTYIPLTNMMTVAAELGIDSCPIEGFNRTKVDKYLADKGIIDPDKFGVSVMLGLGYRDQEQPKKTRQPLDEVLEVIK